MERADLSREMHRQGAFLRRIGDGIWRYSGHIHHRQSGCDTSDRAQPLVPQRKNQASEKREMINSPNQADASRMRPLSAIAESRITKIQIL